ADQEITFDVLPDKRVEDPDFNVSATVPSPLPISFVASGNCALIGATGTLIHLTGAGSCTITASQEGNANWNPATPVTRTFAIANNDSNPTVISFGAAAYQVGEKAGLVHIVVARSGDLSGSSTVDYST